LFSRRIETIFGMLSRRAGLSASAGLSCYRAIIVHQVRYFMTIHEAFGCT